jgi:hypothetical protein
VTAPAIFHGVKRLAASGASRRAALVAQLLVLASPVAAQAAVFEVTNSSYSGAGSCRAAIGRADATGPDVIEFAVGSGSRTITPRSQLPALTSGVVIDGASQPGFVGVPLIRLGGARASPKAYGLVIRSTSSAVRALEITGWGANCRWSH